MNTDKIRVRRAGYTPVGPLRCEERPGIGLCDDCTKPMWPQVDLGYGMMVCLDCLTPAEREAYSSDSTTKP